MLRGEVAQAITVAEIVARLDGRGSEETVRRVLKRLAAARLIVSFVDKKRAGRGVGLYHHAPGAAFSHAALIEKDRPALPKRMPHAATPEKATFDILPIEPDATTVSQVVSSIDRTPETARRQLKALVRAGLVSVRTVGHTDYFYRRENTVFSEEAIDGLTASIKTIVGGWYRDKYGFPTRRITAIDDPDANSAAVHGRAGGFAAARARSRKLRARKSSKPASRNIRHKTERYEAASVG